VLVGAGSSDLDAISFGPWLRQELAGPHATLVLISPPGDGALRETALEAGFDDFLDRPVRATEVRARLRSAVRLRDAGAGLGPDDTGLRRIAAAQRRTRDEVLAVLEGLLDLCHPGASARGRRLAGLAHRLAMRFGVPVERLDALDAAARLFELGHLVGPGPEPGGPWRQTMAAAAVLRHADGMAETAALLEEIHENWDGTGPRRLQQGQIPLRCRILRVAIDLMAALDAPHPPDDSQLLARFAEHVGTLYDPLVIVHLRALLEELPQEDRRSNRRVLPVADLEPGMVLAEDLCTDEGVKLLARGTRISPSSLEAILRRHRIEPILRGASVRRAA
jgi:response regulator RpfG family c-di-GMP phosphodiesterase